MFDVWTRAELRATGMTSRAIRASLESGQLVRARKGHYVRGDAPEALRKAAHVGGRLGCLSLLSECGVFVADSTRLHVHMERGDSRMRPVVGGGALGPAAQRRDLVLHWHALTEPPTSGAVDIVDALSHAIRCQEARFAVATLDSAIHLGILAVDQLDQVFGAVPARFRAIRPFIDSRAEAGTETLVRLLLRRWGCDVELQVSIDGVGRVDLLVNGWLIIECDSKQFHSDWNQQRVDYQRDRALAALGFTVLRLTAEDILYRFEDVASALRGLIFANRRG
ncbi:uncharacterized protein DUF559 [Microbacterium sp. AG790]|nr:uncharacterized protein DUF559 [Microbacterium sp. AG790]